jgi:hypothetical protein
MQQALNPLMRVSDNAAFGRARAPKVFGQPLAVHAVHVVGTHTPLLSNAKERNDRSCNRHATPARSDLHQVRNMETGTRGGKRL